ncbi:hypothetical protein [Planotetraspora sp. GP83]|uniref:hypothetical protein n=1 Tax=Planotetraspora sp. GP83 TaxID=3156264 RepID=UPI003510DD08
MATDGQLKSAIAARAASALEFFRQYAGADSFWTIRANEVYLNRGDNQSQESGARAIADLLLAWCDQVEAGVTEIVGARTWHEAGLASTDVMEQVRRLLDDREGSPVAAIVLCGAALEIALRAAVDARGIDLGKERPSLMTYARALRREGFLTAQDLKDFDQCSGLRNLAAHGHFEALSAERAGLMEQQTNLLLRRIAELQLAPELEAPSSE